VHPVILWPRPTMMPDRIGIIGNTQGVNASNSPRRRKRNNQPETATLEELRDLRVFGAR